MDQFVQTLSVGRLLASIDNLALKLKFNFLGLHQKSEVTPNALFTQQLKLLTFFVIGLQELELLFEDKNGQTNGQTDIEI